MLRWWRQRRTARRRADAPGLTPASVGVDIHCHLLPGVDDGVRDDDAALSCLTALADMGYRGAVLTPHIYPEAYDNHEHELRRTFTAFHGRVRDELPEGFALDLGAEYMLDESLVQRLYDAPDDVLTFGPDRRWMLVELPTIAAPPVLEQFLDECGRRAIQPVLAHAERYPYLHEQHLRGLCDWRATGALVQLNIGSLASRRSRAMRDAAREIARQGLVDLVGTDLHGRGQLESCRAGWAEAGRWLRELDPGTQAAALPAPG